MTWRLALENYVSRPNDDLLLIPMIETRQAVEHFDDIIAVDSLEPIFLGPGDLLDNGKTGRINEINVDLVARAQATAIVTRIVARNTQDCLQRRNQGFGIVSLGSNMGMIIRQISTMAMALGKKRVEHKWF